MKDLVCSNCMDARHAYHVDGRCVVLIGNAREQCVCITPARRAATTPKETAIESQYVRPEES